MAKQTGFFAWVRGLLGWPTDEPTMQGTALREGFFEAMLRETQFLANHPHYAGVLSRMDPIATNTVPVMAVALRRWDDPKSRLLLMVNTDYFKEHPEYRAGVLLHEIRHVVSGHLTNEKFHRVAYPRLMEIAMELTANEGITEALPRGGFQVAEFAEFGVAQGQSTLERYVLLRDAYEAGRLKMSDLWSSRMRDTHRPSQVGLLGAGLGDVLDARCDGASERNWSGLGGLGLPSSRNTLDDMRMKLQRHLRGERGGDESGDAMKPRIAKELQRVVYELGPANLIDWARALGEAFPQTRHVTPDYLRPNRRFPNRVGEIPGRRRRPPKRRLLVAIDTSGSMMGETLDRVVREVRRLSQHARLTIIECDAAVHRVYPLSSRIGTLIGGGDTDLEPAFAEAARTPEVDGLVYFTDGRGNQPSSAHTVPTLWALTHAQPFIAEFGMVLRVP